MRADVFLTENGYTQSRCRAQALIAEGSVTVDGKKLQKPAEQISDGMIHHVEISNALRYVGRGGLKLEAALDAFLPDVSGLFALDIGASTGGFTDCLLQRGVKKVCAVDAGTGQLAPKLKADARVVSLEQMNARELTLADIGGVPADLVVMDVSFISATYLLPRFPVLLSNGGHAIVLIKPQFEVGKAMLGKGGIVKDPAAHRYAVKRVLDAGCALGLSPVGFIPSPVAGGDGNREFLVDFVHTPNAVGKLTEADVSRVLAARCVR